MTIFSILSDAGSVYRLLFRRSIATAAAVYGVIGLIGLAQDGLGGSTTRWWFGVLALVLGFAGPVLVQGALVRIVRNVHEGERPEPILSYEIADPDRPLIHPDVASWKSVWSE